MTTPFPSYDIGETRIAIAAFPDGSAVVDVIGSPHLGDDVTFTASHDDIRGLAKWLLEQVGEQ